MDMNIDFNKTILKSFKFQDETIECKVKPELFVKIEYNGAHQKKTYISEYEEVITKEELDSNGNVILSESSDFGKETYEYKYDDHKKILYKKITSYANKKNGGWTSSSEGWRQYSMGNEIHYKSSDDFEYWIEYDSNGHIKSIKHDNGEETYFETDSNGHIIHQTDSSKIETWFTNDEKGNVLFEKNSKGYERRCEYDSTGKLLYSYEKEKKQESFIENEYDSDGNKISEIWYTVVRE